MVANILFSIKTWKNRQFYVQWLTGKSFPVKCVKDELDHGKKDHENITESHNVSVQFLAQSARIQPAGILKNKFLPKWKTV